MLEKLTLGHIILSDEWLNKQMRFLAFALSVQYSTIEQPSITLFKPIFQFCGKVIAEPK